MMIFAYDKDGIIVTECQMVLLLTAAYYQNFIHSVLRSQIQKLWPKKIDTAPHVAQSVVDLFADYVWETFCHPPYSPD